MSFVAEIIKNLSLLKTNWDGHQARTITPKAIQAALDISSILDPQMLEYVEVLPVNSGGISFEWLDVIMYVWPTGKIEIWRP